MAPLYGPLSALLHFIQFMFHCQQLYKTAWCASGFVQEGISSTVRGWCCAQAHCWLRVSWGLSFLHGLQLPQIIVANCKDTAGLVRAGAL